MRFLTQNCSYLYKEENCEKTHTEQEREKISNDEKSSRLKNIDFLYSFSPLNGKKVQAHAISCKSLSANAIIPHDILIQ